MKLGGNMLMLFAIFATGILLGWKFPSFINPVVPYEKERKIGKPPPDPQNNELVFSVEKSCFKSDSPSR